VAEVERLIGDRDPQIRLTAFRALRQVKPTVLREARRLSDDPSPAVRREVALSLRGSPFDEIGDTLVKLAAGYDGVDRWYLEALGIAAAGREDAAFAALLSSLGHRDPLEWDARFSALAWRLHPPAAIDAFKARAASARLSADARQQAIVALGFVNDPRAAQAMADLSRSPLGDVASSAAWWLTFRKANDWRDYSVDGWSIGTPDVKPSSIAVMLQHRALVLDSAAPIDRRISAALSMAKDPIGGHLLIQLAAENAIVYQLREAIGSVIFTNPDRAVRAVATGYFSRPGGQPRLSVDRITGRAADAARGQARFNANCATCHRPGPVAADVGPDLSEINTKFDLAGLVEAIANPSAAIAFGFGAELFVRRSNESHIGMLQADGATIAIRDGYGRPITISREDLAKRVPLKTSLMPDPLALGLSEQDVADIAAFLMKK